MTRWFFNNRLPLGIGMVYGAGLCLWSAVVAGRGDNGLRKSCAIVVGVGFALAVWGFVDNRREKKLQAKKAELVARARNVCGKLDEGEGALLAAAPEQSFMSYSIGCRLKRE